MKEENVCDLNQTAETITEEPDLNKTLKEEDYSDTKENGLDLNKFFKLIFRACKS